MKYEIPGTMAYYLSAPCFRKQVMTGYPLKNLAINCKTFFKDAGEVNPEEAAMNFYALNQMATIIRGKFTPHEVLPKFEKIVMEDYLLCTAAQAKRLLYYLMLIVTRESRHQKSQHQKWKQKLAKFSPEIPVFLDTISGMDSMKVAHKLMYSPPDVPCGAYFACMPVLFSEGKFGGSFGGIPWANIATCLNSFIQGDTSLEIMVDTAYTLAHNTGPMFNKGMLYEHYTPKLYTVLDIQRSGQMVEYVLEGEKGLAFSTAINSMCKLFKDRYPNDIGDYLDWYKVESLGSKQQYPAQKSQQDKKMMMLGKYITPSGKKVLGKWEVGTGLSFDIVTREALTA